MAIAFGLSCCSAALIVLSPAAATDRAIAVIVSFTYFMAFLRDYRLAVSRDTHSYRRATATRWQDGRRLGRCSLRCGGSSTCFPSFRGLSAAREPGIHNPRPVVMDSGLATFAAPRKDGRGV